MARRVEKRKKRKRDPARLGDVLRAAYPSKEPEDQAAVRAFYLWERTVPARVLANVRPVKLSRGVLTVHAKNSVWASEMTFLEPQVLAAFAARAPEARIRKVYVRVGPLPPRPLPLERPPTPKKVTPVRELPEELARALAGVGSDDLRDKITVAASHSLARQAMSRGHGGGKPE